MDIYVVDSLKLDNNQEGQLSGINVILQKHVHKNALYLVSVKIRFFVDFIKKLIKCMIES